MLNTTGVDSITLGQAVLQRVVAKLGDAAAPQLGLTHAALALFLMGKVPVPDRVLLRAVDVVLEQLQNIPPPRTAPNRIQP